MVYLEYKSKLDYEKTVECRVLIGGRQSLATQQFAVDKGY